MFIIDFDDTLFDTHALKKILAQARQPEEKELKELLFNDACLFLHYLKSVKQKLILLSFGEFEFQNKKIGSVGIAHLFDEIIITPDVKELAVEKILRSAPDKEDVWFINDKIEETQTIVRQFPYLKPLLKMSPRFSEEEYKLSLMPYFSTLTEMQQYAESRIK